MTLPTPPDQPPPPATVPDLVAGPTTVPDLAAGPAADRRGFLRWVMGGAATVAGGAGLYQWSQGGGSGGGSASPLTSMFGGSTQVAPSSTLASGERLRSLVVVELSGGNDGLATLVPYGSGRLYDLRGEDLLPTPEEIVVVDDTYGLHPGLAPLNDKGLAVLMGVGVPTGTQSHFEMEQRWWGADPDGTLRPPTGFLGRMSDRLDAGAPITGVSLGGPTPALLSERAVTVGLTDPGSTWYLDDGSDFAANLRRSMGTMGAGPDDEPELVRFARRGVSNALAFSDVVAGYEGTDTSTYPGGELSYQLALAAWLLGTGVGVRIVHVKIGGFDTHAGGRGAHDGPMTEVGGAIAAFLDDLDARGLSGTTLVATTSEFGRRPERNGNGTDHGTASCALLAGAVNPGLHGEHPSLTELDETDNLIATASMTDYYATLAQTWFGLDLGDLLPEDAAPIDGLLNV